MIVRRGDESNEYSYAFRTHNQRDPPAVAKERFRSPAAQQPHLARLTPDAAVGQVLAFHVNWLRSNGYAQAILYLPHDGINANNITGKRYDEHLRDAGFNVEPPVKNQGRGAAMMRIEALRRLGPQLWWNEATTEPGRDAIGFYHERKDDVRNVGLGPEHARRPCNLCAYRPICTDARH